MRAALLGIVLAVFTASPAFACEPGKPNIPPLAVALDALLPEAKLADSELTKIKNMRAQMKRLAGRRKEKDARKIEEEAMKILGYDRAWLACGPGTFMWMKRQ